ncbi:MAG: hypothetical protein JSV10_10310, partial [Candidatus Zixiibacteriota bacterium]
EEYLVQGDKEGSEEALRNIELAGTGAAPKYDPFDNLCSLQRRWQGLMDYTSEKEVGSRMRGIVEGDKT